MLEMFETEFMQRAWLAGLIVAVICPLIGSFFSAAAAVDDR
mgnify:CR=1 FL=1